MCKMDILKHYGFVVGSNSIITQPDIRNVNDNVEINTNEGHLNHTNNAQISNNFNDNDNSGLEIETSSTNSSSPLSNQNEYVIVHTTGTSTS